MASVTVTLTPEYNDVWLNCFSIGHEMVVKKKTRRIFPTMEFKISGLEMSEHYKLSMHFELVNNSKYRFDSSARSYISSICTEPKDEPKIFYHPVGTMTGTQWMWHSVSFDSVRITNTKSLENQSETIIHLRPGYRYQPVLTIYKEGQAIHSSRIEHMLFLATTVYRNDSIRVYKSSMNKYSSVSDFEAKIGVGNTSKRSAAPTTSKAAKQSRSLDDNDKPLTSGGGLLFNLPLGSPSTFSHFGVHPVLPVVPPMPWILPARTPVDQNMNTISFPFPAGFEPIKSEIETSRPATSNLLDSKTIEALLSNSANLTSLIKSEFIKSGVATPPPAALDLMDPKTFRTEFIKSEISESHPTTPKAQMISATHGKVQEEVETPLATLFPSRQNDSFPLREIHPAPFIPIFPLESFPMIPMMPMMQNMMAPIPNTMFNQYWNPVVLPAQPIIPIQSVEESTNEETDETEEYIDIIN